MYTIGHMCPSALMAGKEAMGPGGPRATLSSSLLPPGCLLQTWVSRASSMSSPFTTPILPLIRPTPAVVYSK